MADHESGPLNAQQILEQHQPQVTWLERMVDRYGFPTAVAIVLGFVLYQFMTTDIKAMKDSQREAVDAQVATRAALERHITDTRVDQSEVRYVLRQICLNTANNEAQRAGCVLPGQAR